MKWKYKYRRIIKRFALLPILANDEYRWLQTVYISQWRNVYSDFWHNETFVDKELYLSYKMEDAGCD